MTQDIEITAVLSKTESVKRDNITATVRTEGGNVALIENGNVTDNDGNSLATFSQWQGSGLNIQFNVTDGTELAILTSVKNFINDVKE